MFRAFYSLAKTPFAKEIKISDSFPSAAFAETTARLEYLKKTRGIGLIIGEP
jgi:general secretion pathway protein A